MLIVWLYVNDLIVTGNDSVMFEKFKINSMMGGLNMSNLEIMHYFLGFKVE